MGINLAAVSFTKPPTIADKLRAVRSGIEIPYVSVEIKLEPVSGVSVESVGGKQAASVLSGGAGWEDGSTPEEGSAADKSSDGESSG